MPFSSGEGQNRMVGILDSRPKDFSYFLSTSYTNIFLMKLRVNWSFHSEEVQNKSSRWPFLISDWNDFSDF